MGQIVQDHIQIHKPKTGQTQKAKIENRPFEFDLNTKKPKN